MITYGNLNEFQKVIGKKRRFYGIDNECFKLGNQVFEAVEDEDDGYRSYLGSVEVRETDGLIFFRTPLATVVAEEWSDCHSEGINLVDITDGHVWLSFGTDYMDDYYPCFFMRYQPRPA